jgi:uncharacterized protein (TIGR02246 family)
MSLLLVPPVFTFPQQEVTMSRAFAPSALLLALLGAACSDSPTPTALASPEMSAAHQAALATNPPGQVGHIEALVSAVEAAWAAKDATAFAAAYAEDVDFIGPLANVISGREALRTQHAFLFGPTGPFRQSTLEVQVRRIEFLTGTIAIVDLNFRLTGDGTGRAAQRRSLGGGEAPRRMADPGRADDPGSAAVLSEAPVSGDPALPTMGQAPLPFSRRNYWQCTTTEVIHATIVPCSRGANHRALDPGRVARAAYRLRR